MGTKSVMSVPPIPTTPDGATPNSVDKMALKLHREYERNSSLFHLLYYATRLIAGLSAAILPFVVRSHPLPATILSVTIIVCVVVDTVFDPKSNYALYNRATCLLALAEAKVANLGDKYNELLAAIVAIETDRTSNLKELQEVLKAIQQQQQPAGQHT